MFTSEISSKVIRLTEFIKMYNNLTLLWDKRHPHYKNRRLRVEAYKKLLKTYKELDSEASLDGMKKKIDVIRNNYSRELKKVRRSRMIGGPEYIPTLWYYDLLSFLENHVALNDRTEDTGLVPEYGSSGEDHADQSTCSNNDCKDLLNEQNSNLKLEYLDDNDSTDASDHTPAYKSAYKSAHEPALLDSYTENFDTSSQETHKWAVIGNSIAVQLQDLDPMQAIFAEKLISDTLYYAKLGRLNESVKLRLEPGNS